jgi:FG-GAP repeat
VRSLSSIAALCACFGPASCATLVGADFDRSGIDASGGDAGVESIGGSLVSPPVLMRMQAPLETQTSAQFAYAIVTDGRTLVATAPFEDVQTDGGALAEAGAAYVFDLQHRAAPPVHLVAPNADALDGVLPADLIPNGFAKAGTWGSLHVALSDELVVISATGEASASTDPSDNSAPNAGAVYVYDRSALGTPPQFIKAPAPQKGALFGQSIALSGTRLIVGAPGEDGAAMDSGAAYIFELQNGRFDDAHPIRIVPAVAHATDSFGAAVAIENDLLVVGAPGDSSKSAGLGGDPTDKSFTGNGAVYAYRLVDQQWTQDLYAKPQVPHMLGFFGGSLSLSGGHLAIGSPWASDCPNDQRGPAHGVVYVLGQDGGAWTIEACIDVGPLADSLFGFSVALLGDDLVVGAPWDASGDKSDPRDSSREYSGAAYLYHRAGRDWPERAYLKAPVIQANAAFGFSVAIAPGVLAVGAPYEGNSPHGLDPSLYSGATYLFSTAMNADGGP